MIGHVGLMIADLLAGRLAPDEVRELEEHVKDCSECAADLAWARELRDRALRDGLRHIEPTRVVAIGAGAPLTEAETLHLETCDACRREVRWSEGVEEGDAEEEGPPLRVPPRWAWAALAAAAAVVLALWLPRTGTRDSAGLARLERLPVRITRSAPAAGSFEEARLLGLEAYAAGEWSAAREFLGRAAGMEAGDAEILLYLGSAEALSGDPKRGAATLERAVGLAEDPIVRDEASWQLANARIASGEAERVGDLLRDITSRGGRRRDDARALLDALGLEAP
jgi:hypothetical protein